MHLAICVVFRKKRGPAPHQHTLLQTYAKNRTAALLRCQEVAAFNNFSSDEKKSSTVGQLVMTFGGSVTGYSIVNLVSFDTAYCVGLAARIIVERRRQLAPLRRNLFTTQQDDQNDLVKEDFLSSQSTAVHEARRLSSAVIAG